MRLTSMHARNLSSALEGGQPDVIARGGLEIKVCVRTYRLFYVSGTEDFLWRTFSKEEAERAAAKLQAKKSIRQKWIEARI